MVKIKEGYVMSPREQAEYDRMNALPRKVSGTVAYYYKPVTKYPARIYVFMHAEMWCDRNRRPMGLYGAFPFLTRPMNREEIEYHHFDTRLCYHQYECWENLLCAEQQEAAELDKERPGTGTRFLEKLTDFRSRYVVGDSPSPAHEPQEDATTRELRQLIQNAAAYSVQEIGERLRQEQEGKKRTVMLILLRELFREKAGDTRRRWELTPENLHRRAQLTEDRRRKNFVRRAYKREPLFALAEIRLRYPGYTEDGITTDLKQKSIKSKCAKRKPVTDLRRCQLQKLALELRFAGGR